MFCCAAVFGLELSEVLMASCEGKVLFLATTKKDTFLQDIFASHPVGAPQTLRVLTRENAGADTANFAKIVEALKVRYWFISMTAIHDPLAAYPCPFISMTP